MKLITIIKNEKFTGTQYSQSQFSEDVAKFHRSQGESWILKEPFQLTEEQLESGDFGSPTEREVQEIKIYEIDFRLDEIDKKKARPISAISAAQVLGNKPNQVDIDKLIALEEESQLLREQRKVLVEGK